MKVMMTEMKHCQLKNILNKIRQYLKNIENDVKKSDAWKIQLTIAINFMFSKDNDEEHVMHSKSYNLEIMINEKPDEVIEETFQSLFFWVSNWFGNIYSIVFIYCIINIIK